MRLSLSALTILLLACVLAPPAQALFITLPDGSSPHKLRRSTRKVSVTTVITGENLPWRQRNEQRKRDLTTIGNALARYRRAKDEPIKEIIVEEDREICRWDAKNCRGLLNLKDELAPYLDAMPVDPRMPAADNSTGYVVQRNYKGQYYLKAIKAEQGWLIRGGPR